MISKGAELGVWILLFLAVTGCSGSNKGVGDSSSAPLKAAETGSSETAPKPPLIEASEATHGDVTAQVTQDRYEVRITPKGRHKGYEEVLGFRKLVAAQFSRSSSDQIEAHLIFSAPSLPISKNYGLLCPTDFYLQNARGEVLKLARADHFFKANCNIEQSIRFTFAAGSESADEWFNGNNVGYVSWRENVGRTVTTTKQGATRVSVESPIIASFSAVDPVVFSSGNAELLQLTTPVLAGSQFFKMSTPIRVGRSYLMELLKAEQLSQELSYPQPIVSSATKCVSKTQECKNVSLRCGSSTFNVYSRSSGVKFRVSSLTGDRTSEIDDEIFRRSCWQGELNSSFEAFLGAGQIQVDSNLKQSTEACALCTLTCLENIPATFLDQSDLNACSEIRTTRIYGGRYSIPGVYNWKPAYVGSDLFARNVSVLVLKGAQTARCSLTEMLEAWSDVFKINPEYECLKDLELQDGESVGLALENNLFWEAEENCGSVMSIEEIGSGGGPDLNLALECQREPLLSRTIRHEALWNEPKPIRTKVRNRTRITLKILEAGE